MTPRLLLRLRALPALTRRPAVLGAPRPKALLAPVGRSRAAMAAARAPSPSGAESQSLGASEGEAGGKAGGEQQALLPPGNQSLGQTDGKQIVKQKRQRKRKESNSLYGSTKCLLMEMPFAEADVEAEFSTKANIQKKRKRTSGKKSEDDNLIKKKKKDHDRPNYFISVPITNPKITVGVQALQDTVMQRDNRLSKAMVHYGSFHITLLVMNLSSEAAIDNAIDGFLESKDLIEELLQGKPLNLSFQGTDHFRNQVAFVKLAERDHATTLLKIAEIVKKIFQQKGIFVGDDNAFKPHLTFMKLSKSPKLRKQGVKKIEPTWFENFKDHYFGDESMKRLDLCSMLKKKQPSGYYHCESSITIE